MWTIRNVNHYILKHYRLILAMSINSKTRFHPGRGSQTPSGSSYCEKWTRSTPDRHFPIVYIFTRGCFWLGCWIAYITTGTYWISLLGYNHFQSNQSETILDMEGFELTLLALPRYTACRILWRLRIKFFDRWWSLMWIDRHGRGRTLSFAKIRATIPSSCSIPTVCTWVLRWPLRCSEVEAWIVIKPHVKAIIASSHVTLFEC